jgi:putative PIN family toxin of toxin-antitoxin system
MRVVLDSNILLSALLSQQGPPHQIYQAWRKGRFTLITASVQLDELRRASRYPKFRGVLQPHRVGRLLNSLQATTIVDRLPPGHVADDPPDAWLLALADAGRADYLVTGAKHSGLLIRGYVGITRILRAAGSCEVIG